jgi:hypothetical protein
MSEKDIIATAVTEVFDKYLPKKLKKRVTPANWNKWILRSALQKAIRRGLQAEALDYGVALFKIDEAYTWYSLMTIAVEDVLELDSLIFIASMYGSKLHRKSLLGGTSPEYLVVAAIRSLLDKVKTRVACEVSLSIDLTSKYKIDSLCRVNTSRLMEFAGDISNVENHYVAMTVLGGKARTADGGYISRKLPELNEVIDGFTFLTDKEKVASKLSAKYAVDSMCLAVPYALYVKNTQIGSTDQQLAVPPKIGNIISPAYDMHTQDGKAAIKAMHTSINRKNNSIGFVSGSLAVPALGAAIFILEGGLIDKRYHSERLDYWTERQNTEFLTSYGKITKEQGDLLLQIVSNNQDVLHQKREWAVGR